MFVSYPVKNIMSTVYKGHHGKILCNDSIEYNNWEDVFNIDLVNIAQ